MGFTLGGGRSRTRILHVKPIIQSNLSQLNAYCSQSTSPTETNKQTNKQTEKHFDVEGAVRAVSQKAEIRGTFQGRNQGHISMGIHREFRDQGDNVTKEYHESIVTKKNTKHALWAADPWAADRPAGGWPPEGRIVMTP
jgi:hypothetical protein